MAAWERCYSTSRKIISRNQNLLAARRPPLRYAIGTYVRLRSVIHTTYLSISISTSVWSKHKLNNSISKVNVPK